MTKYHESDKARLLETALKYARMKVFGRYLANDGAWNIPCHSERKNLEDHYLVELGEAAVNLLCEMTAADPGPMP